VVWSAAGVILVVVALAKEDADAIEVVLLFIGSAILACAGLGISFLRQRRQMAEPMTPMPHDARLVSRRQATWGILFGIVWLVAVIDLITRPESLAAFGGLATGLAAAYAWQAHWIGGAERKRGERWFSEWRIKLRRRKPPYFARAIR
jgi:hypothetical protein